MPWWLKAAEELRTLRRLGIARPGSVISGLLLDVPPTTIEGRVRKIEPATGEDRMPRALSLPAPPEPTAATRPAARSAGGTEPPSSSFLRGEGRYKLHWGIRPQARKTASK